MPATVLVRGKVRIRCKILIFITLRNIAFRIRKRKLSNVNFGSILIRTGTTPNTCKNCSFRTKRVGVVYEFERFADCLSSENTEESSFNTEH